MCTSSFAAFARVNGLRESQAIRQGKIVLGLFLGVLVHERRAVHASCWMPAPCRNAEHSACSIAVLLLAPSYARATSYFRIRLCAGGGREATVTEVQAGSAATLVYDGSGQASVKEFTASGLVEDSLYAFKVDLCKYLALSSALSFVHTLVSKGESDGLCDEVSLWSETWAASSDVASGGAHAFTHCGLTMIFLRVDL